MRIIWPEIEEPCEGREEVTEILFKSLGDRELRASFETPDDDPGPRCAYETPEEAFRREVTSSVIRAVLARLERDGEVEGAAAEDVCFDLVGRGHSHITSEIRGEYGGDQIDDLIIGALKGAAQRSPKP